MLYFLSCVFQLATALPAHQLSQVGLFSPPLISVRFKPQTSTFSASLNKNLMRDLDYQFLHHVELSSPHSLQLCTRFFSCQPQGKIIVKTVSPNNYHKTEDSLPRHSERAIRKFATFKRSARLATCLSAKAAAITPMQTRGALGGAPFSRMQLHYNREGET